jgi:hypothetical protein
MKKLAVLLTLAIILIALFSCKSDGGKSAESVTGTDGSTETAAVTDVSTDTASVTDEGAGSDAETESDELSAVPGEELVTLDYRKTYTLSYEVFPDYIMDGVNLFIKPKFAAVSDDAIEIQAEIDALYEKYEQIIEQMESGTYEESTIYRITYDAYVTDRYLTLLLTFGGGPPASEFGLTYRCIYYDMQENRRADLEEILADMGYTLDDVVAAAHDYFFGMVGVKPITSIEDLDAISPHCQNRIFAAVKDYGFSPRGDFPIIK